MNNTLFSTEFQLRPLPGSRVKNTSAHTQGAGVSILDSPVKGKSGPARRIQYPQRLSKRLKGWHL